MQKIPSTLYHYTNQTGFLGIIDSRSLWATKIHFLNDSSEYQLALDVAKSFLESYLKSCVKPEDKQKLTLFQRGLGSIERLNVCVCSFSGRSDLLSQWRAYSETGGYSLGFKTKHLTAMAAKQRFSLVKCIYRPKDHERAIAELVERMLKTQFPMVPSRRKVHEEDHLTNWEVSWRFADQFARIAPLIKSSAFHEEAEWRLISNGGVNFDQMSFRAGKSSVIPYFSFQLGQSVKDYLRNLTIGPTPHPALAENATFAILAKDKSAQQVAIKHSVVPYRTW